MPNNLLNALQNSDFTIRYERLIKKYPETVSTLEKYEVNKVLDLFKGLGYEVKYDSNESFFFTKITRGRYTIQLNISIKYGVVECILAVYRENKLLSPGGPFGKVIRQVDNGIDLRGKPFFDSYETLNIILIDSFSIIEDLIDRLHLYEKR